MQDFSYINNAHPSYLEALYNEYLKNPNATDPNWKIFFEAFDYATSRTSDNELNTSAVVNNDQLVKEFHVCNLIYGYRSRGHLLSDTNPIRPRKERNAELNINDYKLSENDLNTRFAAGVFINLPNATLAEIVEKLKKIYTGHIGIQYTYINNNERKEWVKQRYEELITQDFDKAKRYRVLEKLNEAVTLEKFLNMKFIGQKRFGLDGGESTIPALDAIINQSADNGVKEVVIGMAHRGRLNVLTNILGKSYEQLFSEFEGIIPEDSSMGSGDVKYHLGFRNKIKTANGKEVLLHLIPNPSHLEAVNPVVAGYSRAKVDNLYQENFENVLPIIIHGDAAVAGQGVIYELLQMSRLEGYKNGGTIHFVINNQIGFTTDFTDARSSDYCTSIAALVQTPVLHVNGDDPEAVVKACMLAVEYRNRYNDDVFIDMVCYRRNGHNEGDEPKFTQPVMYGLIDKHKNIRDIYADFLKNNNDTEAQEMAKNLEAKVWQQMQDKLDEVRKNPPKYVYQKSEEIWSDFKKPNDKDFIKSPKTGIAEKNLTKLFNAITNTPEGFKIQRKILKLLQEKQKHFNDDMKIDWATGELLAYASILAEGKNVRLSGEDVKRGTFSHRHAVIFDEETNKPYSRLSDTTKNSNFYIYNSLLSEYAVLGFDYGYAMASPQTLTIWEAQFGDFANSAQIIFDQYISGAEEKWTLMNGLVVLLPHGYEGGGPEHSNGRPERFLQLAAENNMVITNITTAANLFHAYRRQLSWNFRKPLINFSPKANLRHPRSYSDISEFTTNTHFQEVIDDPNIATIASVKKVILCSGKVYFDLSEKQIVDKRTDIAIVRLEQLYPTPVQTLKTLHVKYKNATWQWVQEEPANMGALAYLKTHFNAFEIDYLSRPASASVSTGFGKVHSIEQKELIEKAFVI